MDELRLVRRDENSLIVATETGEEFRLIVDDTIFTELKNLRTRVRSEVRVRPREIQTLLRSGKTRAEVVEETGASEEDVERYATPVLAEIRYIIEQAQAVAVRTAESEEDNERFGGVITERLEGLAARDVEWSAWRHADEGWMVGVTFSARDVAHRAVWSFDHRKSILSPTNSDATSLSKQGEVGDRLIPKLRAVELQEHPTRFDSDAFDPEALQDAIAGDSEATFTPGAPPEEAAVERRAAPAHPARLEDSGGTSDDEYARIREIEQRAIKTPDPEPEDLGQTADLLDALRKRRGERESTLGDRQATSGDARPDHTAPAERPQSVPLWAPEQPPVATPRAEQAPRSTDVSRPQGSASPLAESHQATTDGFAPEAELVDEAPAEPRKRGRASIPSWDDILFGTRSEDDPA